MKLTKLDNGNTGGGNGNSSGGTGNTPPPSTGSATGCRIDNVDPASDISSKGYKVWKQLSMLQEYLFQAVGAQQDCEARCKAETVFNCRAYLSSGPGTPCVLYGEIDRQIIVLRKSKYYLQDMDCVANCRQNRGKILNDSKIQRLWKPASAPGNQSEPAQDQTSHIPMDTLPLD